MNGPWILSSKKTWSRPYILSDLETENSLVLIIRDWDREDKLDGSTRQSALLILESRAGNQKEESNART